MSLPPRVRLSPPSLRPKRVLIHSNPTNTTLKELPSCALVQTANEALARLDAKADGALVTIRGACVLPSGDVSFYTHNKEHQKWLMNNKHIWSKEVHPDLEATPRTFSVMAHGVPRTFNITSSTELAHIASENGFQFSDLVRLRWWGRMRPWSRKREL